jgi:hypothetical protein
MTRTEPTRPLVRVSLAAAVWALLYALYRGYYGLGGTFGRIGVPASEAAWRTINLVGVVALLVAAVVPLVGLRLRDRPWVRRGLLAFAWIAAVGCIGHAIVDDLLRILSLAGRYETTYPPGFWLTVDRRQGDLQDLLFNETWFLIEGLLWAGVAWTALGPTRARAWWVASVVVAVAVFVGAGLASAFGLIGRAVVF